MKTFNDYEEAKEYARFNELPLWDTRCNPDRYVVGHLTAEIEADPDNNWIQLA
jgi:hypothetical protein